MGVKMKLTMKQLKLGNGHMEVHYTALAAFVYFKFSTIRRYKENYEAQNIKFKK